jgi:hypothetical protein
MDGDGGATVEHITPVGEAASSAVVRVSALGDFFGVFFLPDPGLVRACIMLRTGEGRENPLSNAGIAEDESFWAPPILRARALAALRGFSAEDCGDFFGLRFFGLGDFLGGDFLGVIFFGGTLAFVAVGTTSPLSALGDSGGSSTSCTGEQKETALLERWPSLARLTGFGDRSASGDLGVFSTPFRAVYASQIGLIFCHVT